MTTRYEQQEARRLARMPRAERIEDALMRLVDAMVAAQAAITYAQAALDIEHKGK